jgi:hypothetical protein
LTIWYVVELSKPVEISSINNVFFAPTTISPVEEDQEWKSHHETTLCTSYIWAYHDLQCCISNILSANMFLQDLVEKIHLWSHVSSVHLKCHEASHCQQLYQHRCQDRGFSWCSL